MRIAVFAAASMLAMASVAYGQTDTGSSGGASTYSTSPPASTPGAMSYSDQGDRPVGAPASTQPDPNNCGTPDEPKPCGPRAHRAYRAR